ncbi:hypothetical protein YSA_07657 [Pseudomonas putida ND6]|uniref:Uncharacterized protein n=1 Tax=Pseudomonas putida ND6 TaxID=231023 RepID=I3UZI7_PSEPU|nr:hypothetical protein YSA_07657 [Pseudomonas putida ND6]
MRPETDRAAAFEHPSGCGHAGQHRTLRDDLEFICQSFKHEK